MSFDAAVHAKAIQLDKMALEMCAAAGSGHPTTALSLGHITTVLMYHAMRWTPDAPEHPLSDRLVLSEGHACPIIYAACADLGVLIGKDPASRRPMTRDDAMNLRKAESPVDGHPNPAEGFPFFDAATGSLGMGLSIAAGLALAARHDEIDRRIYCIIGDGESREGQVWEAADFIVDHRLTQVLPIFNCNAYGQSDKVSPQQSPATLAKKLEAFGFHVRQVDGHDPAALRAGCEEFTKRPKTSAPMAIVAVTVKGWGAPSMQGGGWHGKPATGAKLTKALEELDATGVRLTSALASDDTLRIFPPTGTWTEPAEPRDPPSFSQAMKNYDMASTLATGRFATRKAAGLALRALGHTHPRVMVLDADVRNSTFTEWFALDKELSDRFVECRIAEQNMISAACGLSAAGKIPFCATFSKFVTRAYDQVEMALNSGANLKILGSHSGISLAADGPSQMSLPDVSWFRAFTRVRDHRGNPGFYLLQPADAFAAYGLTLAMADHEGCCYMRTARPDVEFIYDDKTVFNLGKFEVLTKGRDLLIVTAGFMVHECNKAIDLLDKQGIDATLVDLYSIPFDQEAMLDLANDNGGNILTVEDNYAGGLGSALADALTESGDGFTLAQMFVDRIPKSARDEDGVLRMCGLDHTAIAARAAAICGVGV
ncbi:MAG: transketolase [Phycisphaeraceae bacterium]|nr:transketolase [Phycisphaeraceae bacterium]